MSNNEPKKVGLIIGREWSWPSAFITEVNKRDAGVKAEFVKLGGTALDDVSHYDVIIDRMSHEIPYYRVFLKHAALQGTYVINNPFTWAADDRFFGIALAAKLGLPVAKTVVLPNKRVETQVVPESFRNLQYPMNWRGIIDYVGVPAILRDAHGQGNGAAFRVHDVDDLIRKYDESDTRTMMVQEIIQSDERVHCFVVGDDKILPVRYSLKQQRYLSDDEGQLEAELVTQIRDNARAITRAYGYDINMVEFAVREGVPYLVNATDPAPEMDINVLKPAHFSWCVAKMADFAIEVATQPRKQRRGVEW